jgi:phage baseplate assembly protein W
MTAVDTTQVQGHWQSAIGKSGAVVQGDEALNDSIRQLLTSQKGEDVYRKDYGINWLTIIDEPAVIVVPLLVTEAQEAMRRWLPEIAVQQIEVGGTGAGVVLRVFWRRGTSDVQVTEVTRG